MTHAGGAKGKELLAGVKAAGAQVIECPKVTRFAERLDFVRGEFRRAGQRADDAAARALLDAVGSDLRELAAACEQLAADAEARSTRPWWPPTTAAGPRRPASRVADHAVEGHLAQALEQLRWALATGVSPVLICSALAQGVRLLGRVGSAPRGQNAAALAAEVGAPPWKIDRVRQQLRGWHAGWHRPRAARRGRSRRAGQGRDDQRGLRAGTGRTPDRRSPAARQRLRAGRGFSSQLTVSK